MPVKGGGKRSQAVHGEGLALIGICNGKGTQCQKAGNMQRALVKANAQNDEVQVATKVAQQGQFALLAKNESVQQASRLIHCSTNSVHG